MTVKYGWQRVSSNIGSVPTFCFLVHVKVSTRFVYLEYVLMILSKAKIAKESNIGEKLNIFFKTQFFLSFGKIQEFWQYI